ncbi:MAG: acetyl-CoA C-acetyltransferase [Porticoccaceae bacterium]|nr:acetyl-CoA C-acetyltransferase [Porticoccaceae bacterium]
MTEAYIIDTCRTPRGIGKIGKGSLAHIHPQKLAATVLKALAERNNLNTEDVNDIIWGCNNQTGKQSADLGRMAALEAGYSVLASGVTLDRFCGSGITSVSLAAAQVMSGMEDVVIGGGTEMMSYTGSLKNTGDNYPLFDRGNLSLRDKHPQSNQGICADAIATIEGIDRDSLDKLAVISQQRAERAIKEHRFDGSLVPVLNDDGSVALDREEFPRPGTSRESLAGLNAVFDQWHSAPVDDSGETFGGLIEKVYPQLNQWDHVHHAGNSSGVVDGAAGVLLTSKDYAEKNGLTPRARIVATANIGDCPTLMLNAPVPAAKKVLAKAKLSKEDIDVWEINEAFAVVAEKFIRDLDLDREKVNINGGAMALGHPIAATGAILIGTALDELERSGGRYALITMCAGGGMAPAIIIERV